MSLEIIIKKIQNLFGQLSLVCLWALLSLQMLLVNGQPKERLFYVCGAQIPLMMDLLCKGRFNTWGKRAFGRDSSLSSIDFFNADAYNEQYEFDEKRQTPRFQRDIGIATACCRNPCSRSTMLQYCQN